MEMPHFLSFGCKDKKMFYYDWDEEETFEEVKLSMQLDIDDTLVDLVLDEEASFFVYSSDLDMLGIVKEVLVDAISALLEGHLEAEEYVDNMAAKGRYDEQIVWKSSTLWLIVSVQLNFRIFNLILSLACDCECGLELVSINIHIMTLTL